jgi:hypothetical protein
MFDELRVGHLPLCFLNRLSADTSRDQEKPELFFRVISQFFSALSMPCFPSPLSFCTAA